MSVWDEWWQQNPHDETRGGNPRNPRPDAAPAIPPNWPRRPVVFPSIPWGMAPMDIRSMQGQFNRAMNMPLQSTASPAFLKALPGILNEKKKD
jgi:hypothetical protein